MRRVENQRLGDAEVTQIFAAPGAHTEITVEHLECHPRAQRAEMTTKTDRTRCEIAIAPVQDRNPSAPACGDRTQVERRMPTWHDDDVRTRLCDRACDESHIHTAKTLRLETTASRRWLKDAMGITIGKRHVPLERFTEADALLVGRWRRRIQDGEIDVPTMSGDMAEERRHVLHRVGLHERDPATHRHAAIRSQTLASRPASACADHGSSAARSIDTCVPAVRTNAWSASAIQPTTLSTRRFSSNVIKLAAGGGATVFSISTTVLSRR